MRVSSSWLPERIESRSLQILTLFQSKLNQLVGPILAIKVAARYRQTGSDAANTPGFLVEIPNELAPGRLFGVAFPSFVKIAMRGPKRVISCDGIIATRFINSRTSGGSWSPSIGKPRFTTPSGWERPEWGTASQASYFPAQNS
jgi:hypothetical protein